MAKTPKQPKELELTQAEWEKIRQARDKHESKHNVDKYWFFIAQFGYYYGWGGIDAILTNKITMEEAQVLLEGANKVWASQVVNHIQAAQAGNASTKGKKGAKVFRRIIKVFQKEMRI